MALEESKRSVILVTNDLGPHVGGIETFILGLLGELDGHDIVIYTSKAENSESFDKDLTLKTGVKIFRDKSKVLLPTPRVTKEVIKLINKFESKIVWFGAAAPLGLMAKKLKKNGIQRSVAITHGHEVWWAKIPIFRQALRKIGNGCDVITYLGNFTRDAISGAFGTKPNLIQIAPGIELEKFSPGPKPIELVSKYRLGNEKIVICVGRLVKRKGQDQLIKSLAKIRNEFPKIKLLIVGSGPLESKLRKLIKRNQLDENVIMVGRVSYEDLPKYFRLGDIFAMPVRSRNFGLEVEGLGIVYLEASASGLPVIVGNSGGAPDALIEGETGYLVDGRNPTDIAERVSYLLRDPVKAATLGKNGRDWVETNWSWPLWGAKFAEVLRG